MGGKLFAGRALHTPRFSTDVYQRARRLVIQRLQPFFEAVETPICAPEKTDHGDIDVSTGGFLRGRKPTRDELGAALDAAASSEAEGRDVCYFAIPWIDQLTDTALHQYIQVDVNINASIAGMRWQLFKYNHGDLCAILGNTIRPHYLVFSEDGLYLRLTELLEHNIAKKKARILLSSDPFKILKFLELDEKQYYTPFETVDEMLRYATTCRFYRPWGNSTDNSGQSYDAEAENSQETKLNEGTVNVVGNSNDRKRAKNRTVYATWTTTFLPQHVNDITAGQDAYISQDALRQIVFDSFGEEVRRRFEQTLRSGLDEIANSYFWSGVRAAIPAEGTELGDSMAGLRRDAVYQSDAGAECTEVQRRFREHDFQFAKQWCLDNWQLARDRYREYTAEARRALGQEDTAKANPWSTKATEVYSQEDDAKIFEMKALGRSWADILEATGKKSRSQLMAHWKNHLQKPQVEYRTNDG